MSRSSVAGRDAVARRRVERVVPHHQHVVPVVTRVQALPERLVRVVRRERLAGGQVPDLPCVPQRQQHGHEVLARVVQVAQLHPVDEEEVDVIGLQPAQAVVDRSLQLLRLQRCTLGVDRQRLGGQHDAVAPAPQRLPDDLLGAVDLRGVHEVDAEVEGSVHYRDRLGLGGAVRLAESAVPAAPETGDGHVDAGPPQAGSPHRRPIVGGAADSVRAVAKLYLVRHAHAGSRGHDGEPDDRRGLSDRGWRQAEGLSGSLAAEEIGHLVASPFRRCVQTLEPLGRKLGLPVEVDGRLAERSTATDALAVAVERRERGTVLCSHGDVIPDLLEHLLAGGTRIDDELRWPKASTWVFSWDGDRIANGRFLDPPA